MSWLHEVGAGRVVRAQQSGAGRQGEAGEEVDGRTGRGQILEPVARQAEKDVRPVQLHGIQRQCGFDRTAMVLQRPVAAARGAAGGVGRGGDVGAGGRGQDGDEAGALAAGRHVAAVEQDVAVLAQRRPQLLEQRLLCGQGAFLQLQAAQLQRAAAAVADQMDGAVALVAFGPLRHLLQCVAGSVEHHDLHIALDRAKQRLVVGEPAVDERHLRAAGRAVCSARRGAGSTRGGRIAGRIGVGRRGLGGLGRLRGGCRHGAVEQHARFEGEDLRRGLPLPGCAGASGGADEALQPFHVRFSLSMSGREDAGRGAAGGSFEFANMAVLFVRVNSRCSRLRADGQLGAAPEYISCHRRVRRS
ncbi:hypothetical protein D3C78_647890 [compost metagenome]